MNATELLTDTGTEATELRLYLDGLTDNERANLLALAEMKTPAELEAMAAEAPDDDKRAFVENARVVRQVLDTLAAQKSEPVPKWELPVLSLSTHAGYAALANMQKGAPLKFSLASGWVVMGRKPSEAVYPSAEVVADLFALGVIVPAIGQPWDVERCKEFLLSALGWRGMGCLYVDQTAKIELRVYEVAGTDKDTDHARMYRQITADWRARQARRDTTPGWNRYSEFALTISDKITEDGAKTVTCTFEATKAGSLLELFGDCLNSEGYVSCPIGVGYVVGKTVSQHAFEVACQHIRAYSAVKKAEKRLSNTNAAKKPPKPPLVIVTDDEDADELARSLGIL